MVLKLLSVKLNQLYMRTSIGGVREGRRNLTVDSTTKGSRRKTIYCNYYVTTLNIPIREGDIYSGHAHNLVKSQSYRGLKFSTE